MDEISKFIDEIRTFKIVVLQSSFSEESLSLSEISEFKSLGYKSSLPNAFINLYIVHRRSEPLLKELYNNARLSLTSLSKDDIQKAARQVLNFYIGDILKKTTFYSREYISNKFDDNQRSELFASLEEFSKEGSIECDIFKERAFISHDFFQALIKNLATKNSYSLRLMKDIAKVLKEKIIIEEKENPHIFHIHENTLLELLNEKIGIHDDIEESMPSETGQNKLNVSDSKIENGTEGVKNTPSKDNTKKTPQIKTLFNFIDFLHANIDTFNQYDNVLLELNEMFERFSQLGFHYTEKVERDALQEGINEKWDVIFKNIVNPIKDKIAELELFDWSAQEMLSNNYFHIANTLSKTYDEKDLDTILKAKTQYIEFTNKISPRVIKQAERMFEYLYEVMVEIAKNFYKEGDKRIKHEEVRRVETLEELVEGFNAGEKVAMPLLPSILTQSDVNKEVKPESNIIPIKGERKNMTGQQIFDKINELTTEEYEEKYYLDGYNESTLTTLDPKIIHLTFSDIHSDLNEAFELIYLRGEFDFLERIKAILNIDLKTLNNLYEAGEWVPECTYEIEFEEFIEREKSFELIYNCKTQYIQRLIDKLNEYASVSEKNKVQQTIESETITQSTLSSSDNDDDVNIITEYEERVINTEKLERYFKPQFKGMGRCENDFETLIKELETITEDYKKKRIGKKIAQIALLIHNSDKLNARRPEHFIEWHKIFCECISIPYTRYFPSSLEPLPKKLKDLFIYLN